MNGSGGRAFSNVFYAMVVFSQVFGAWGLFRTHNYNPHIIRIDIIKKQLAT